MSPWLCPTASPPRRTDGPAHGSPVLQPGKARLQHVEAHGTEVEGVAVEALQVEVRALARLGLVARPQPDPLADLVRRRLPRPAEVAVQLEAQVLVRHPAVGAHELPAQLRGPPLAGVEAERVVAPGSPAPGACRCRRSPGPRGTPGCRACRACRRGRPGSPARPSGARRTAPSPRRARTPSTAAAATG